MPKDLHKLKNQAKKVAGQIEKEAGRVGHQIEDNSKRVAGQIGREAGRAVDNVERMAIKAALHDNREAARTIIGKINKNCDEINAAFAKAERIRTCIRALGPKEA